MEVPTKERNGSRSPGPGAPGLTEDQNNEN